MKLPAWSAAMVYADPLRLAEEARTLETSGCTELHADISDGSFSPEFALNLRTVAALKACCGLPVDVHLAVHQPERHIPRCIETGCTSITLHVESTIHIHRAIHQMKDAGLDVGIAINAGTPLTKLEYLLSYVDRVHVMLADPGSTSTAISKAAFDRVKILRENIDYHEYRIKVSAEGPVHAKDVALLGKLGANLIVLDNASIFATGDLANQTREFLERCDAEAQTV